jgi:hypothetical protein
VKRGSPGVAHDGDAGRRWGTDDGRTVEGAGGDVGELPRDVVVLAEDWAGVDLVRIAGSTTRRLEKREADGGRPDMGLGSHRRSR